MSEVEAQKKPELLVTIEEAAPRLQSLGIDKDRWTGLLWLTARENRELLECSPASFVAAAAVAARLGLEPGGKLGHFWLIPKTIRRKGQPPVKEVVPIIGYRGLVELARRAGVIITPGTVYERDHYVEHQGTHQRIDHRPYPHEDRGRPVRWYAVASFPDGRTTFRSLTRAEVEERRKAGSAPNSPAWRDWYDAMARKSAIRALWAQLPTIPALQEAERVDGEVLHLPPLTGDVQVLHTGPDVDDFKGGDDGDGPSPDVKDAQPQGEAERQSGEGGQPDEAPSSPDTPTDADRIGLQLLTVQQQRDMDDHDLVELIRDRHGIDVDDIDAAVAALTPDQAQQLVDELGGGGDG